MNAATNPGLGELGSTRPLSRAERRAEAARVHAEQQTAAAEPARQAVESDTAVLQPVVLPTKAKKTKRPFSTQLRPETITRLDWIQRHGTPLTDTVDAAINAYLDAAGVPQPDANGRMPA